MFFYLALSAGLLPIGGSTMAGRSAAELEPLRPAKERALSLERFVDPHELDVRTAPRQPATHSKGPSASARSSRHCASS
jgi:hypothetical protein